MPAENRVSLYLHPALETSIGRTSQPMARDVGDGSAVPSGTPPDHDRNRRAARAGIVWEYGNGKEDHGLREASGAGRGGQSFASDRSRARSARLEHHGILQGIQCPDGADGKRDADPGCDHSLPGPVLHFRDEAATGFLLSKESLRYPDWFEDRRPWFRGHDHESADSRDCREKNARS